MKFDQMKEIKDSAAKRVSGIKFGETVTNVCAGESNPRRVGLFVKKVIKTNKNRFGVTSIDLVVRVTDGKGKFWDVGSEVIFPGEIPYEECVRIFSPIWDAMHG